MHMLSNEGISLPLGLRSFFMIKSIGNKTKFEGRQDLQWTDERTTVPDTIPHAKIKNAKTNGQ